MIIQKKKHHNKYLFIFCNTHAAIVIGSIIKMKQRKTYGCFYKQKIVPFNYLFINIIPDFLSIIMATLIKNKIIIIKGQRWKII